jgi:predicted ATPase
MLPDGIAYLHSVLPGMISNMINTEVGPARIVITGGPGAGKTTLIEKLSALGYSGMEEAAREVIDQYEAHNINPWGDLQAFVRLVYERIYPELQKPVEGLVFCDRSMLDCIAYLKEADMPVPDYLAAFDPHAYYSGEVFILAPWPDIYRQEKARRQSYSKAVSLYKRIRETYQAYGFLLTEVPPLAVEERVGFIFEKLNIQQQVY